MATVILPLIVKSADIIVATTNTPELVLISGTNFVVSGYALGKVAAESLCFQAILGQFGASNTDIKANFVWYARAGTTSSTANFSMAIARYVAGTSVEATAFATAGTVTSTCSATAKGAKYETGVSCTLPASLAANDEIEFLFQRTTGGTLADDAVLTGLYLSYSDV